VGDIGFWINFELKIQFNYKNGVGRKNNNWVTSSHLRPTTQATLMWYEDWDLIKMTMFSTRAS